MYFQISPAKWNQVPEGITGSPCHNNLILQAGSWTQGRRTFSVKKYFCEIERSENRMKFSRTSKESCATIGLLYRWSWWSWWLSNRRNVLNVCKILSPFQCTNRMDGRIVGYLATLYQLNRLFSFESKEKIVTFSEIWDLGGLSGGIFRGSTSELARRVWGKPRQNFREDHPRYSRNSNRVTPEYKSKSLRLDAYVSVGTNTKWYFRSCDIILGLPAISEMMLVIM